MFVKVSFVAAASVAAFAVSRINIQSSRKRNPPIKLAEKDDSSFRQEIEEDEEEKCADSEFSVEEDVKRSTTRRKMEQNLSSAQRRESGNPQDCTGEIKILQNVVKEIERERMTLEGKLLEIYGIQEKRSHIAQLQKHLKARTEEVEILSITANSLLAERKKLQEGVKGNVLVVKQLEIAKKRMKDLHEKMSADRNWVRGKLMTIAQRVSSFEKAGMCSRDHENVGKKIRDVELKAMEMKRRNKELEMERRGLRIMLVAAEDKATALSNMTQTKMKAKLEEEMNSFRHANERLSKQIENLQKNRLGIIEELMYQRSLNTCLRFESQHYLTTPILSKNSSQESDVNKSTPAPIPYHNSYSKSSSTSSIDSTTIDSSSSSQRSISKKYGLIHHIRRWERRKGNSRFGVSSSEKSSRENFPFKSSRLIRRLSMSDVPLQRNEDESTGLAVITPSRKIKRVQFCTQSQEVPGVYALERDSVRSIIQSGSTTGSIMGGDEKKASHCSDCSGTDLDNGKVESGNTGELHYSKMLPNILHSDRRVWTPVH